MTSQKHLDRAAEHERLAQESWERSDTDGFLSQYAHGIMAQLERAKARIEADDGTAVFNGLYQNERRVKAKIIVTRFGPSWMLHEDEVELTAARGKRYLPTGENSRVLKALGLAEKSEIDSAYAVLTGSGTGLAGVASCRIITRRAGDQWGETAMRVEE